MPARRRVEKLVPVPRLVGCPKCGLPVQAGQNPDKLAFHDCNYVVTAKASIPATVDSIRSAVLLRLRDAIPMAAPKDLLPMLAMLDEYERPRAKEEKPKGDVLELQEFLGAGVPRP